MNIKDYLKISNILIIFNTITKHKSFQNFVIISFIAVFQLFSNVILGRELPKEDFGRYSFVFLNVINLLTVLFLFGQSASIIRHFSSKNIYEYQWKTYLTKFILVVSIPIILVSFILSRFYHLSLLWWLVIIIGLLLKVSTDIFTPFLRANGKFNTAVILERADPVLFLIMLVPCFFLLNGLNLISVAVLKLISYLAFIPYLLYIFSSWRSGSKKVENNIIKDGFALWEINITVIVLTSVDAFFIAKLLNFEELALFNIMDSVMQIYEFTRTSIFNIYTQKFSKAKNINISKLLKLLIIIIICIGVFYLFSTNTILYLLFNGKYKASLILIILFCIYGSINILYIIPSCYLVGHSSRKEMRLMSIINIFTLCIKVLLIYKFSIYGLNGFLIAAISSQLIRTVGGYCLIFFSKK